MADRQALLEALREERDLLVTGIFKSFARIEKILTRALDEHAAGNFPEARILMNEALDIECDVTGDTKLLSPLSEEWGVDYERDQREPFRRFAEHDDEIEDS